MDRLGKFIEERTAALEREDTLPVALAWERQQLPNGCPTVTDTAASVPQRQDKRPRLLRAIGRWFGSNKD